MFENLTYKQKFFGVIIGFVILLLAAYKKTLRHTLASKQQLNIVEQRLEGVNDAYNDLANLRENVKILDNIIGGNNSEPQLVQRQLLNFITKQNFKANIVGIKDVHKYRNDEFTIYTNQIEIQGSYNDLLNLLYMCEKNFKDSRILSAKFYTKKNYTTRKEKLYLNIILQNYEKNI